VLDQQAHDRVLLARRRKHERCRVAGAAQVDGGAALQQLLRHQQAATRRGRVQQPVAVRRQSVHVSAVQPLDHLEPLAPERSDADLVWHHHVDRAGRAIHPRPQA